MEPIIGADGGGSPPADVIKDSNTDRFAQDVIEASLSAPVIVDFWAPWCGPCKQLTPLLEKTVTAARGAVRLVKINIDENQDLAAQMRVQSIPTVYAFYQGRPVDAFQGALPESQIKTFIDRLTQTAGTATGANPIDQALEEAEAALETGETGAASALFGQVLQHEAQNIRALAGTLRCLLATGDHAGARRTFDGLPEDLRKDPAFAPVATALELAEAGAGAGEIPDLEAQVAQNGDDHQARFDLAMALYAADKSEAAADELLEIIRRDRSWNDEGARKQLVKFFEAWGATNPLTLQARRRLSSLLFS
ncbi:MAG: thioredoxin [Rhodospirillales bacterium]|nr:thioredoxin [Rhodospirillales bacterium]MDH3791031.1 thioredoxin [Rhodospirillales bacterium]MDH3913252.1 thioredoxin [Rhodospirillales bacterium]MDH3916894.1 thioredoxin [Rhodospirillales bacterium]MDH3968059.1 thioredoxin [Rhodospirillales bacterium]